LRLVKNILLEGKAGEIHNYKLIFIRHTNPKPINPRP